jgi:hypothetical protein
MLLENKTKYIIIIILTVFVLFFLWKNKEHLTTSSSEAVLNIAKVYGDVSGTASFTNLNVTGTATFGNSQFPNDTTFSKNVGVIGDISGSQVTVSNADTAGIGGRINLVNPQKNQANSAKTWSFMNMNAGPGTYKDALELWKYDGRTGAGSRQFDFQDDGSFTAAKTITAGGIVQAADIYSNGVSLANCNWNGEKRVTGDSGGCGDDLILTCSNNRLQSLRFAC